MCKRRQEEPESHGTCAMHGCDGAGIYKAPKSRESVNDYHYFCLDHIRDYNRSWDYFSGYSRDQIEQFMKDALTGHRPTWKMASPGTYTPEKLEQAFHNMMGNGNTKPVYKGPPIDEKQIKALADLDIQHPTSLKEIKTRYKLLVKKYHPDVTKGNKEKEERFKLITGSYHYIIRHYKHSAQ